MAGRHASAVVVSLLALAWGSVWADGPAPTVPRMRAATWKELHFAARKLGISASIDIRLDTALRASAGEPAGAETTSISAAPGGDLVVESTTHLPGRTFVAREVLDPSQAAAREIVDTETGARHHRKTYTLTDRGFQLEIREPGTVREMLLPPERWTREVRSFTVYPGALPAGAVLTGPAGLLYVASAADLSLQGDSVAIFVLVQTQVERVTAYVEDVEQAPLDFQEESPGRLTPVHEQRTVLRLVVHGQPVGPATSSVFRLFGLEGDVEILWDPVRRLPVQMAGRVKMLGRVEVRLVSMRLR